MDAPILPVCPTCKQTDQVQKVTSIYGVNTKEWYETHTSTDADGHTHSYQEKHEAHTQLGLKLKPPQQPPQPTHPGLWYGSGGLVAFVLLDELPPGNAPKNAGNNYIIVCAMKRSLSLPRTKPSRQRIW